MFVGSLYVCFMYRYRGHLLNEPRPPPFVLMMKCFEAYSLLIAFLGVLARLVMAISDLFKTRPPHGRHPDDDLLLSTLFDNYCTSSSSVLG